MEWKKDLKQVWLLWPLDPMEGLQNGPYLRSKDTSTLACSRRCCFAAGGRGRDWRSCRGWSARWAGAAAAGRTPRGCTSTPTANEIEVQPYVNRGWLIWSVTTSCWPEFGMFRHPAWAVGSYSSGPSAAGTVWTKSMGGFYQRDESPCRERGDLCECRECRRVTRALSNSFTWHP